MYQRHGMITVTREYQSQGMIVVTQEPYDIRISKLTFLSYSWNATIFPFSISTFTESRSMSGSRIAIETTAKTWQHTV